ncbi:adhesion G protein-coupled receptor F5-like [Hippoglossus hippoglossus]|uniref:adhesion G protein-coupled receptor F5-like n=1 Tax=Hippoglossus hippoglossus TaxID=8267 RepID=UPI00148BC268|nr:adhesion G protein-coupled receptor F5-like [Hippoglossus hippoglossus]
MNKMWGFILLYILGLNISQATGEAPSTQMYYVKLTIDKSAITNNMLPSNLSDSTRQVDELHLTTTCKDVVGKRECRCESGHRWSDNVCQSNSKCCGNDTCTFPVNSSHVCVSTNTVTIRGSIRIQGTRFHDCLADEHTEEFQNCSTELLHEMKKVYSTLRGFDVLKITKYGFGSIVADLEMTISKNMSPDDLMQKSEILIASLTASLNLETTGVVDLTMPHNPVKYGSQQQLVCTSQEDLSTMPVWWQKKDNEKAYPITNGTEADMTSTTRTSRLTLKNMSAFWEGQYTCEFHQKKGSLYINHSASAVMDVALLPNIFITTVPEFPRCRTMEDLLEVRGKCLIREDNETYNVTWRSQDMLAIIIPLKADYSSGEAVYVAETGVGCDSPNQRPKLTCTFHNILNQTRDASFDINIIYVGERFCEAEGDWGETKAGLTAVLQCKDTDGLRQRKCRDNSTWEQEEVECVNNDVSMLLRSAHVVDIGRGSLNENAEEVFNRLGNVTNNSMAINTVSNMKATVDVLGVLSQQQRLRLNGSGVDGFLESSSNLMEKSLEKTWTEEKDDGNLSLAETYISSVEKLIEAANITTNNTLKNIEVATCNKEQGSGCTNTAFGVTVDFDSSDNGSVATAGFKQLENYLPHRDEKYGVNSIVVMTTTQKKHSGSVVVKIKFPLLRPRPRNVEIKCVSWEYATRQWSPRGCEWMGPHDDGHCVCSHLSSFAILMARDPIVLPGMAEITIVGLSISVMSLVINLVIELIVWRAVVKTNTRYLRHVSQVNISLCLLVADCCFLASFKPHEIPEIWCKALVMLKHFCYLSMFFWMFCLSSTLLHQTVFLFHNMSKKIYIRFYISLGYACPLLIVLITFLTNSGGAEGVYFSKETCWLVYSGLFRGSIHTFIIPVGTIIIVNVFSMVVVIMKLLDHPKNAGSPDDRSAAKSVMRTVILLTPIFGVTWIFGFGVTIVDLSSGIAASLVNYVFILLNSFQGLFILLTTFLGDNLTREALLKHLKKRASVGDSSMTLDTTLKN